MSGTTPNLALPYPTGTDLVHGGAAAIEALAQALDGGVAGNPSAGASITLGTTKVYRRSGVGLLLVEGLAATGAIAGGATIATLPAGYRPKVLTRAIMYNFTGSAVVLWNVDTDGTVKTVPGITSGHTFYGSVAFPL